MSRNKLYSLIMLACTAGYTWLGLSYYQSAKFNESTYGVCLIKHSTDIPCPSCGSTRSILALLSGNIGESILINPLGVLLLIIMMVAPLWIIRDLWKNQSSMLHAYHKIEMAFRKKTVAIPFVLLIICNWAWNIYKGL